MFHAFSLDNVKASITHTVGRLVYTIFRGNRLNFASRGRGTGDLSIGGQSLAVYVCGEWSDVWTTFRMWWGKESVKQEDQEEDPKANGTMNGHSPNLEMSQQTGQ